MIMTSVAIANFGLVAAIVLLLALAATTQGDSTVDHEAGLVGYWKLAGDSKDSSGNGNDGQAHGVAFDTAGPAGSPASAATLKGRSSFIEVPDSPSLRFGTGDVSISAWVKTEAELDDVLGDIVSKYDPSLRKGLNLNIKNHAGVTSSQSNYRNLHFGIDNDQIDAEWTDCGRPGNAVLDYSMCVFEGDLYVGTFETEAGEAGTVYRYAGGTAWDNCGSPDSSNAAMSLAVHKGHLYVGMGFYRAGGSALPDSPNETPSGHVYRYEGNKRWVDCGQLGEADDVHSLTEYQGRLYALPLRSPGVYVYDGESTWTYCGTPADQRAMSLGVYNGGLFTAGNGSAGVWRYLGGEQWESWGQQEDNTQTYSFAVYEGDMYVGTWPSGSVYRYAGGTEWDNCGRLGEEKEVMGMAVYNGKLYAGTLPLAEVYRYDGDDQWTLVGRLDFTPDVTYHRTWTMAVCGGKLYAGTLPSGHVLSMEAGKSATHDYPLEPGWRHVAAIRAADQLRLYVDGELVAQSTQFSAADYDISNDRPLKIGFGAHDYFNGAIAAVRIYNRALSGDEITALYATKQ